MSGTEMSHSRIERSRARILDAAQDVIGETGYDAATVDAIATRAGLTRKTVYNHFPSKEAVADAVVARAGAQAEPLYGAAIRAGMPALDLLVAILGDSAEWCVANPDLARRALAPRLRPTAVPPDRGSFQGIVVDAMQFGQSQGVIRSDEDAGFLSLVLLGLYAQAMLSALDAGGIEAGEIGRIVRIAVEGIGT
ncbi:TetR/AcrR family transcriptional regulator [uncultured Erythrobacter sp.]|uniref:TetR/AcrR family transcriptional regulator n=1 Tax=uncultured Erythrobacter sp. TaxID=263913 RepID=UPI00260F5DE0|nr:TetR/AcrR family transcriptional regulator [uncultured Erythrobacter sp.]